MTEEKANSSPSVIPASLDHTKPCWYWDKEDLAHTPSQLEGLDPTTETRYRREGARFIFDVGTRLGLRYDAIATGIVYFHRFYMFHSFKQFSRYVTGVCALFLAGKVEETPKKCKDIIKIAHRLLNDVQFGQFGHDPKEEVMARERLLLWTIKFDLQVVHPYQFLLKYAKQLKGSKTKIQKLVQMAWTFINDSLHTTLSLQWEPEIIAVSVMYLAGRLGKFEIQKWTSKPTYSKWWEQFVEDVPVDVLEDICHQILDLYSQENQQVLQHIPNPEQQAASPQPSPPKQVKQSPVVSPKEDKAAEPPPSKVPRLETTHPPRLPVHPPPECKPSLIPATSVSEDKQTSTMEADHLPKVWVPPPPSHPAPISQPPFLPHPHPHPPPPPLPSSYITGMSNTNYYMSVEGYQTMQSMMKTEGPVYEALPPVYVQPVHLPYNPHIYPQPSATCPTSLASFPPPIIPPLTSGYFPQKTYGLNFPPPGLPPNHAVPSYPFPRLEMPPASYPPPAVPLGGQPSMLPPLLPTGMPPIRDWHMQLR